MSLNNASSPVNLVARGKSPWWGVALGAWLVLVWLLPAPPEAALERRLAWPAPGQNAVLASGRQVALDLGDLSAWPDQFRLQVACAQPGQCQDLRVSLHTNVPDLVAKEKLPARLSFQVPTPRGTSRLWLVNYSRHAAPVRETEVRNYLGVYSNFPRLTVVRRPYLGPEVNLATRLGLLAAAWALLALGWAIWRRWLRPRGGAWAACLPAGAPLVLGLAAVGLGLAELRLLLAWDAWLLAAALGPLFLALAPGLAWLGRAASGLAARLPRPRRTPRPLVILAAAGLVLLLPPLLLPAPPAKRPFVRQTLDKIRAYKPDYVFVGNSWLDSRVDGPRLGELLGGKKVALVVQHGTCSAVWFLLFKNYVVASGTNPKKVFVFFKENELTNPKARIDNEFDRMLLQDLSPGEEPLIDELVYDQTTPLAKLQHFLQNLFPVTAYQGQGQPLISQAALDLTGLFQDPGGQTAQEALRQRTNQVFKLENFRLNGRGGAADDAPVRNPASLNPKYWDFDRVVGQSFLPHIIDLARENHLDLVFIRIQSTPTAHRPAPADPRLAPYLAQLAAYLAREGVVYHDFTGDPEITLAMYSHSDHIHREYRARWTEVFYQRLRKLFP
ncbi:MAG: hypothetical protein KQJ78_02795 [Deltaproteobacteria bacterium]|nr:hypothetical protein [Deltaproteobacteria bacterium]